MYKTTPKQCPRKTVCSQLPIPFFTSYRSVLGPPTFIIFTVDLIVKVLEKLQENTENVETAQLERGKLSYIAKRIAKKYKDSFEISLYADDTTTITTSGDDDFFVVYNQIIIDTIETWTNENKLKMNAQKIVKVKFGTKENSSQYHYGKKKPYTIPTVPRARLLGVYFTTQEGKGKHINLKNMRADVYRKLKIAVAAAASNLHFASFETFVTVWNAYIIPILNNVPHLWSVNVDYTSKIQIVPPFIRRTNNMYKKFFSYKEMPENYNPMKLPLCPEEFFLMMDLKLMHDIYNGRSVLKLHETFNVRNVRRSGETTTILSEKCKGKIAAFRDAFRNRRVELFNQIPHEIKMYNKLDFKNWLLKSLLPTKCVFSKTCKEKIISGEVIRKRRNHISRKRDARYLGNYNQRLRYRAAEMADAFMNAGFDQINIKELGLQNSPLTDKPTVNDGYFSDSSVDSDEEVYRNAEFTYINNNETDIFYD